MCLHVASASAHALVRHTLELLNISTDLGWVGRSEGQQQVRAYYQKNFCVRDFWAYFWTGGVGRGVHKCGQHLSKWAPF